MEAGHLIISASVTGLAVAALAVRLGARLPGPPWAEVSLAALFAALLSLASLTGASVDPPAWLIALSMAAWLGFLAVYPTGRPEPRLAAAALAVACVPILGQIAWPALSPVAGVTFIASFTAGTAAQIWRYQRRSSVAERQATKWLLLGLIPALGVFLGFGVLSLLPAVGPGIVEQPSYGVVATLAMWAVPVAGTVGLVMGDRGPVDPLVVGTAAVVGTAFGVAIAYFVSLSAGATAGWATVVACLVVVPLLACFRWAGERLAYARGPHGPLSRLPGRLAAAATPDEIASAVADTLRTALGSPSSAVLVDDGVAATSGSAGPGTLRHPVAFQGEEVAILEVVPRAGETQLSARDRRTLGAIASQAAPALFGARAALRAAGAAEMLARTREEERARLHADLHDDLGPTLAALGFMASAASSAIDGSPDTARTLLAGLEVRVHGAVARVRELAYDLRPPELERLGLVAMIRERIGDGPPTVVVRADLDGAPLAVDLQVAALRIVQEAVANVRRHAEARRCEVTLRREAGSVVITVTDDGVGPPGPVPSRGIGLTSIAQRAREFDGTCEFGPGQVGSVLRVTLREGRPS